MMLPVRMTDNRVQLRPELWTGEAHHKQRMRDHCVAQLIR